MAVRYLKHISAIFIFLITNSSITLGQNKSNAQISGKLSLDDSWDSEIYLSHIPTYDDMYVMSNEMIIAKTKIDNLGYFKFNIDFLPYGENLYRLHIIKKGDTPATLIIGGKDENHCFLIVNHNSNIQLICNLYSPPFRNVFFENSADNVAFQGISNLVYIADSIAAESTASKRMLIENQLQEDLLQIADTSNNFLVSLYAIYKTKFESNYASNLDFYESYVDRWENQDNNYIEAFTKELPISSNSNLPVISTILTFISVIVVFLLWKFRYKKNRNYKKLSIQERKIYELLQQGVTNQEISNHFNIGLSTVKSHVSSIYGKLNIKSRKDILNLKYNKGDTA